MFKEAAQTQKKQMKVAQMRFGVIAPLYEKGSMEALPAFLLLSVVGIPP